MNVFEELLNLVLPTPCCGCSKLGDVLCLKCRGTLIGAPRKAQRAELIGWAFCDFDDQVSRIMHAFKEGGQTRVAATLASKMTPLLENFNPLVAGYPNLKLVSVPSRPSSFIKRGFVPARVLAKQISRQSGLGSINALSFQRLVQDQAGLGLEARKTNLVDSMVAKFSLAGSKVLIIDDIVTTGATMLEAGRALKKAGAEVVGFLAFAETMLKTSTQKLF